MTKHFRWLIPTLLLVLITPFTPYLDISIAQYFYSTYDEFATGQSFYHFMYHYGFYPGWAALGFGLVMYILSFFKENMLKWRKAGLLIILVFILGPALLINAILKEHWGRPRPRQVTEFGGKYSYQAYYQPTFYKYSEKLKSFPSGHVSMGFIFFAIAIAGKRVNNRMLHISGYILAYGLGISLGVTRMAMGGHFFTDVLLSGLLLWYITLGVEWLIYERTYKTAT